MGGEEVVKRSVSRDNEILGTSSPPLLRRKPLVSRSSLSLSLSLLARSDVIEEDRSRGVRAQHTRPANCSLRPDKKATSSPHLATPRPNHPVITIADRPEPITSAIFASKRSEDRLARSLLRVTLLRLRVYVFQIRLSTSWSVEVSQLGGKRCFVFLYIYICITRIEKMDEE